MTKAIKYILAGLFVLMLSSCGEATLPLGSVTPETFKLTTGLKLSNINRAVRSQDDFYRYANGLWLDHFVLPADRSSYGTFNQLGEEMVADLDDLLHTILNQDPWELSADKRKVRNFFVSYMNAPEIDRLGIRPLAPLFDEIEAVSTRRDLYSLFGKFSRIGINNPVLFSVKEDPADPSRFLLHFEQSGLGMPGPAYYSGQDARTLALQEAYRSHIEKLLSLAGFPDAAVRADRVFALEQRLSEHVWPLSEARDRTKVLNVFSFDDLESLTPGVDWAAYLSALDAGSVEQLVIAQPSFFRWLAEVLESTGIETWKDYLRFHMLSDFALYLPREYTTSRFDFYRRALSGIDVESPRNREAFNLVTEIFKGVFGHYYVEEKFDLRIIPAVREMTENLRRAFIARIEANSWMSPATKREAIAKAESLVFRIAYPDRWRDYSVLEMVPDDLIGNIMRYQEFEFDYEIGKLTNGNHDGTWDFSAIAVNAYYDAAQNEIILPAAILRGPLFDIRFDPAENYGALGAIIGHEIVHAFDDQGRKINAAGQLANWWTTEDEMMFEEAAENLVAWAGAWSPIPELTMDGRQTLGENIGDLEGLSIAYDAYKVSLGGELSPRIAGFTGEQRLFLSWAQMWAEKLSEGEKRRQLLTSLHALGEYRANGVLPHIPGFYEAFALKPGDALYLPEDERIRIW